MSIQEPQFRKKEGGFFLALLFFLLAPALARADAPRHVTLIVCPGLTYRSLMTGPLRQLTSTMAVGLLSPGNARKPNAVENLYASLYAGDTANTKNPHKDLLRRVIAASNPPGRVTIIPSADQDDALADAESAIDEGQCVFICGLPPVDPRTGEWDRLSIALIGSPSSGAGASLTSDTTQTPGLVALRDVAPSVLSYAGISIPHSMTGHAIERTTGKLPDLAGMDALAHLNQVILLPTMWAYGLIAFAALLSSIWSLSKRTSWRPSLQRYLLRVMMGAPLALMLAALPDPSRAWPYGLSIVAIGLLLGAISRVDLLMTITALVIAIDGLCGAPMISRSSLSAYWISGIRFYGIGNEYMGILIGATLVSAYAAAKRHPDDLRKAKGALALGIWMALLTFLLSYPAFGAKAGGAITALVAFAPAWLALTKGRRIDWRVCVASAIAGFCLVFVWAAVASMTGARETHIQTVAGRAAHGDIGYIWHIAIRKAKMAIATATVPGVITTYVGLFWIWVIWRKTSLKEQVRQYLATDPAMGIIMRAAVAGSAAALLFNDSGFVAFVFIFGAPSLTLLQEMLARNAISSARDSLSAAPETEQR